MLYDLNLEIGVIASIVNELTLVYEVRPEIFYYPITKYIVGILSTIAITTPNASKEFMFSTLQSSPHSGLTDLQIDQAIIAIKNAKPSSSFKQDVEQLKKLAQMRNLSIALKDSDVHLKEGNYDKAKEIIFDTVIQMGSEEVDRINSVLTQSMIEIFPLDSLYFIPSGFDVIDQTTGGFGNEELITLAADSGSGKSTLMQIMAINAVKHNYSPVYFNLEMSSRHWFSRYFSHIGKIPHSRITLNAHNLDQNELDKIFYGAIEMYALDSESKQKLKTLYLKEKPRFKDFSDFFVKYRKSVNFRKNDIIVISSGVSSVADIFQKANALRKSNRCDIVYVDYINMLLNFNQKASVAEKLASIVLDLKNMSKVLNIPVVCAAQWNKAENDVKYARAIRETSDTLYHWAEYFPANEVSDHRYFAFMSHKSRNAMPLTPKIMEAEFNIMTVQISFEPPPEGVITK